MRTRLHHSPFNREKTITRETMTVETEVDEEGLWEIVAALTDTIKIWTIQTLAASRKSREDH